VVRSGSEYTISLVLFMLSYSFTSEVVGDGFGKDIRDLLVETEYLDTELTERYTKEQTIRV
jgi:hypothetical protein